MFNINFQTVILMLFYSFYFLSSTFLRGEFYFHARRIGKICARARVRERARARSLYIRNILLPDMFV